MHQLGKGSLHPGLRPANVWNPDSVTPPTLIIEITGWILKILNAPLRHPHRVFYPLFVFLPKLEKGQNCLSYRVDVDGVSAVRIVLRSAVWKKHTLLPKAITSKHRFVEFIGLQVVSNPFQCYQHET